MGRNGDRPPWDGDPKEHMGMVEMGSYETNTSRGTVGTGSYETETPWGATGTDPCANKPPYGQAGARHPQPRPRGAPGGP